MQPPSSPLKAKISIHTTEEDLDFTCHLVINGLHFSCRIYFAVKPEEVKDEDTLKHFSDFRGPHSTDVMKFLSPEERKFLGRLILDEILCAKRKISSVSKEEFLEDGEVEAWKKIEQKYTKK